jgi:hypothetical protein
MLLIVKIKFGLIFVTVFWFTKILPDGGFIVPHRTDAIASGPEMQPVMRF